MKKVSLTIIGAGGFGHEVYCLIDKNIYDFKGFIDYKKKNNKNIIGHENEISELIKKYDITHTIIAIGEVIKRKNIYLNLKKYNLIFPIIINQNNSIFSKSLGQGTILYPGAIIMNNCVIGDFTLINSSVTLGHDVHIGNYCNINPGVNLAGQIKIGNNTIIGIGSTVRENVIIGNNVIIGAGSVVVSDVPDNSIYYGVPAKKRK